jgi:glutamine synthetase
MSRFSAIETIFSRSEMDVEYSHIPNTKISDFFGCNVFNDEAMQKYLSEDTYLSVKAAIQSGSNLDHQVANTIAIAMKQWAMDMGATHYAHWFQPLTGKTAEKHDSFFTLNSEGKAIEEFSGKELAQQEPDGSSFPGGGLRSTFEARGYTAWDPSSPAFILEVGDGKTLCIPTIFVTYSGDALDYKLPLLKSQAELEEAAIPICQLFDSQVNKVFVTLGWEQEYFLIDEAMYNSRPDLILAGRTLIGKISPRGQQLDDHYFGSIPERVYAYMRDLETECHKLGIPVRTRHNEVAPCQYELAPQFEEVNIAVDHNQLLMDVMERVAKRHKFRVLLHEKPFAGVNGSGKHNNWSMATNTGKNLLSPGDMPGKNLRFLSFFVNTIRAVYEHADLLRASVATPSNDHRLGANEAPPAIVSVFIGEFLEKLLNQIESGNDTEEDVKNVLNLLSRIPDLQMDNTDRNRTSPFAFTGNKFEIRMVGSSQNCAATMTIMNTIMAQQLRRFRSELQLTIEKDKVTQDVAVLSVIRKYIKESKPIVFAGDGYSQEWKEEAEKRGLKNEPNTPHALMAYLSDKAKLLWKESGVFSEKEILAHIEVMHENYVKKLQIESRTLGELVLNHVLPAAINYMTQVAANINESIKIGLDEAYYKGQMEWAKDLGKNINSVKILIETMREKRHEIHHLSNVEEMAIAYCNEIKPLMDEIRICTDNLEYLVDDNLWPLIKYREILFLR